LSPPVRLMILKYFDSKGRQEDNLTNSIKAIEYANKMKVQIINYSGGGSVRSASEFVAIQNSQKLGILFVAAAGNGKSDTDYHKYYPASYGLNNIISVAAATNEGELVGFSNYGRQSVDIAAPGDEILSALPHKQFGLMSGTSQATAFVTGAAARIMASKKQSLKPEETLFQLLKKAHPNKSLNGKTKHQVALINE
jgi:subtilisin family serine protease